MHGSSCRMTPLLAGLKLRESNAAQTPQWREPRAVGCLLGKDNVCMKNLVLDEYFTRNVAAVREYWF